jgi:prolyl oligopeptidase
MSTLISNSSQRFPDREGKARFDTQGDVDAMLYYHRIGTPQCEPPTMVCLVDTYLCLMLAEDVLVHRDKENPEWLWSIDISEDGKYFFLYTSKDTSRVGRSSSIIIFRSYIVFQENLLWVAETETNEIGPSIQWKKIQNEFVAGFDVYVSTFLLTLTHPDSYV